MYYQDIAIILNRHVFRDDDLLVTFFSHGHGKINALATGAKKIKSKLAGHLEPINLVEINWVVGKGGEKLIGAQIIESYKKTKNNLDKTLLAQYILEVIDKTTKTHQQDKNIYNFLQAVLSRIKIADEQELEIIKISFDYKIMYLLGYDPRFRQRLININLQNIAQQIVNSTIDKIIEYKITPDKIKTLDEKAREFLQEVTEGEIKSKGLVI